MAFDLDPWLAEILACPGTDHGRLDRGTPSDPHADALTCTVCHRSFPVVDGIPVLLLDDAFMDPASGGHVPEDPAGAETTLVDPGTAGTHGRQPS